MPRTIRNAVHELTSERGLPVRVALPEGRDHHEEVERERRGESARQRRVDEQREGIRVPGHERVEAEHSESEQRVIRAPAHVTQRDRDRHVQAALFLRGADHRAERRQVRALHGLRGEHGTLCPHRQNRKRAQGDGEYPEQNGLHPALPPPLRSLRRLAVPSLPRGPERRPEPPLPAVRRHQAPPVAQPARAGAAVEHRLSLDRVLHRHGVLRRGAPVHPRATS
mmetsp:Transcript_3476/g.14197  ORF Transcript_3476/g.14197 Transcript_3476/m.14197 type:complete len:224 (+) Transcript_3476:627-1298(+)